MKTKITIALLLGILLVAACTGVRTMSSGMENEAFLVFIGNPKQYPDGVNVNIDDKTTFTASLNKDQVIRKGNIYSIAPGKHMVTVSHKNTVLYKKQIFISAQETRKIILP